ncbi:MAG: hypothetical protein D6679_08735 [Candidatus Hydrogenedentota bacterium]|nr:MAG: hypothetical protein D6679_08735 [Candidatus Hydrogenedentota bacterium]
MSAFLFTSGGTVRAARPGLTPGSAIPLGEETVTGTVTRNIYYKWTASENGLLEVRLTPTSGEADLALIHFSGNPTIESRREGLSPEEVAIRVRKGDEYLIRVSTPLGRRGTYSLRVRRIAAEREIRGSAVAVPHTISSGKTALEAVELPVGKIAPVLARGKRYFKIAVPSGVVLDCRIYPINADLTAEAEIRSGGLTLSARSARSGLQAEEILLPPSEGGMVYLVVTPPADFTALARYGIVARLREPGVTPGKRADIFDDANRLQAFFQRLDAGSGVPADVLPEGEKETPKVLRLE